MFTAPLLVLASLAPAVAPVPAGPQPSPVGRAFLGVRAETDVSLLVSQVVPDMPAAKAGLRAGDRLVRVGSLEPVNFDQFKAHIQTYRPGATVEIEVDRNGHRQTFRVRLAAMPEDVEQLALPYPPRSPND
ncbi:MAG TPA: PDZ domain-containing protein [Urbifossiella sp.]|nr:PDZ domain-containing protein [Urbifossiella sp.]